MTLPAGWRQHQEKTTRAVDPRCHPTSFWLTAGRCSGRSSGSCCRFPWPFLARPRWPDRSRQQPELERTENCRFPGCLPQTRRAGRSRHLERSDCRWSQIACFSKYCLADSLRWRPQREASAEPQEPPQLGTEFHRKYYRLRFRRHTHCHRRRTPRRRGCQRNCSRWIPSERPSGRRRWGPHHREPVPNRLG
jgi:hypothetical protein